jgi:uncharacterized protein YneF (UPF0154 family)
MAANWTYKTNNKLRGAYGQTDFDKKEIVINKKAHRKNNGRKKLVPNPDGSENKLITILHEMGHKNHPKMSEKGVEKLARAMKPKLSTKQKQRLYAKFS